MKTINDIVNYLRSIDPIAATFIIFAAIGFLVCVMGFIEHLYNKGKK
jgi:hypothetical protein